MAFRLKFSLPRFPYGVFYAVRSDLVHVLTVIHQFMRKAKSLVGDDLRPEYRREDLGKGVRGKYFSSYQKGSNLVLLNPDVAKAFPTSDAVNEALRGLLQLTEQTKKLIRRSTRTRAKGARAG
jgi:hypothetical protein